MKSISQRLREHFDNDGHINDSTTDALYREAHKLPDDTETDLETVETWAVENAATFRQPTCTPTVAAVQPLKPRLDDPPAILKPGHTVKYSDPQPGEEEFRFTLLENYDGRAKIQLHCAWFIKPTESVKESDITPCL